VLAIAAPALGFALVARSASLLPVSIDDLSQRAHAVDQQQSSSANG